MPLGSTAMILLYTVMRGLVYPYENRLRPLLDKKGNVLKGSVMYGIVYLHGVGVTTV
jgi:hypothetical protein